MPANGGFLKVGVLKTTPVLYDDYSASSEGLLSERVLPNHSQGKSIIPYPFLTTVFPHEHVRFTSLSINEAIIAIRLWNRCYYAESDLSSRSNDNKEQWKHLQEPHNTPSEIIKYFVRRSFSSTIKRFEGECQYSNLPNNIMNESKAKELNSRRNSYYPYYSFDFIPLVWDNNKAETTYWFFHPSMSGINESYTAMNGASGNEFSPSLDDTIAHQNISQTFWMQLSEHGGSHVGQFYTFTQVLVS